MPYVSPPNAFKTAVATYGYTYNYVDSGIAAQHPIYEALRTQRRKCRDIVSGQDTIKAAKTTYLPKLSGQTDEEYSKYLHRALFFSIGAKSLQALVGMASLKNPTIKSPKSIKEKYFNFDEDVSFVETYARMVSEVCLQNQAGAYVDWPEAGGSAYIVVLSAESIINWYDSDGVLELVVIQEDYYKRVGRYGRQKTLRHRELTLDEHGEYIQKIYEDKVLIKTIKPTVLGSPLKQIPFFAFHSKGLGFTDEPPLFIDIANVNLSHYLSSADLEHGRHFTGLPTPIITGANTDAKLHIGSNQFIVLPDRYANAKYLEFTGQGLQSLEKALEEKQAMLASLSARLLDNSSKGSESTDAVKLRYLSETASLTTIVKTVNVVLNLLYNIIAESMNESEKSVSIKLDTDFLSSQIGQADMVALFDGYIGGAIDLNTLVYNLRTGLRLNPNMSDEEVMKSIEQRQSDILAKSTKQS